MKITLFYAFVLFDLIIIFTVAEIFLYLLDLSMTYSNRKGPPNGLLLMDDKSVLTVTPKTRSALLYVRIGYYYKTFLSQVLQ